MSKTLALDTNILVRAVLGDKVSNLLVKYNNPHSARNGMGKIIKKQAQVGDSSVGRQEKRNLKCEDEEPTN